NGARVETCGRGGAGDLAWAEPVQCPGEQSCRANTCQDPTARMRTQADSVDKLVDSLAKSSAWHEQVDAAAVKARERKSIFEGDATDGPFFGAAWRALNAF